MDDQVCICDFLTTVELWKSQISKKQKKDGHLKEVEMTLLKNAEIVKRKKVTSHSEKLTIAGIFFENETKI